MLATTHRSPDAGKCGRQHTTAHDSTPVTAAPHSQRPTHRGVPLTTTPHPSPHHGTPPTAAPTTLHMSALAAAQSYTQRGGCTLQPHGHAPAPSLHGRHNDDGQRGNSSQERDDDQRDNSSQERDDGQRDSSSQERDVVVLLHDGAPRLFQPETCNRVGQYHHHRAQRERDTQPHRHTGRLGAHV
ncbi:hypothetical protein PLICRDRAFT_172115 [Plicaturopsis crispa FD-325 SS-3]|nr:hypothetical protein PLICRDRAFT_172115 [Plicaturopsis crispa FD-325 SS-3]